MGNIIISAHFPIFIFTITQKSFNKNYTKKNYRNPFRIITTVRAAQLAFLRKKLRFSRKKQKTKDETGVAESGKVEKRRSVH